MSSSIPSGNYGKKLPLIGVSLRHEFKTENFYLKRFYSEALFGTGAIPVYVPLIPKPEYINGLVAKLDGVLVKIWPDSNARISRVEFKTGTGQPAVDDAIRQALFGLRLDAPPPAEMPLPIVLRLAARAGFTAQR